MDIHLNHIIPFPLKENIGDSVFKSPELTLKSKHAYVFSAPSGKGKSTLLSYLYGLRSDYTGDLLFGTNNVRQYKLSDWALFRQGKLAMVFQDLRLFPYLTALENIHIKSNLRPIKSEDEILKMAKHLGVEAFLNKPCGKMSMGQQQRIAILRALCQPFEWILLDEPFSHLDAENSKKAMELIQTACQSIGAGMVLTSLGDHLSFNLNEIIAL